MNTLPVLWVDRLPVVYKRMPAIRTAPAEEWEPPPRIPGGEFMHRTPITPEACLATGGHDVVVRFEMKRMNREQGFMMEWLCCRRCHLQLIGAVPVGMSRGYGKAEIEAVRYGLLTR